MKKMTLQQLFDDVQDLMKLEKTLKAHLVQYYCENPSSHRFFRTILDDSNFWQVCEERFGIIDGDNDRAWSFDVRKKALDVHKTSLEDTIKEVFETLEDYCRLRSHFEDDIESVEAPTPWPNNWASIQANWEIMQERGEKEKLYTELPF